MTRLATIALAALALAAATVSPQASRSPAAGQSRTMRVVLQAKDVATSRYRHVPFEVPAGTTRIDIELSFDAAGGANVLDLGLLEPGSLEVPTHAYRGWSGGERKAIFVAVDDATPGYWPGPIAAGTWNVQLGLYKIAPGGVEAVVTVKTSSGSAGKGPDVPRRPVEPLRGEARWYAGALHTHTLHSDGKLTTQELAREARAAGMDFLAVTDHNNTAHQRDAIESEGLLVFSGEEVTTPGGHASVWGLRGERAFVDFRVQPGDPRIGRLVEAAHAAGGLFSINHPFADCLACSWTHGVPEGVDGIEISNPGASNMAQAIALWDSLLRAGRRVTAVGSSDWHRPGERTIDVASVRVFAPELSERAILGAIKAGRVIVMASAKLPAPSLSVSGGGRTATVGDTLTVPPGEALRIEVGVAETYAGGRADLVWRGEIVGSSKIEAAGTVRFTHHVAADGYLRIHVHASDGSPLALTNPVWIYVERR